MISRPRNTSQPSHAEEFVITVAAWRLNGPMHVMRKMGGTRLCHSGHRGSDSSTLQPTEIKQRRYLVIRYKKDQVGADDNTTRTKLSLLPPTHLAPTTILTGDAKDLASIDFTPRGDCRRPDLQLHRRTAGSDQGFERGPWRSIRNDWNNSHDSRIPACGHSAVTRRRPVLSLGTQVPG